MHRAFLERAVELALNNVRSDQGGPFGAVIVRDGQILAEGANLVVPLCDPTAHAEVVAIRRACQELKRFHLNGCDIYSSCEPCPMCLGAIYWAHLDRVYYAATKEQAAGAEFDDSLIYSQLALPAESRSIPMIRIDLGPVATAPFEQWLSKPSRIRY